MLILSGVNFIFLPDYGWVKYLGFTGFLSPNAKNENRICSSDRMLNIYDYCKFKELRSYIFNYKTFSSSFTNPNVVRFEIQFKLWKDLN